MWDGPLASGMAFGRVRRTVLVLLGVVGAALTACSGGGAGGGTPLPDATTLLRNAAAEMRTVQTAHFTITTEGTVAGISLRGAEGTLTRAGDVQGTAQLDQAEIEFIIVGDTAYIKGPTGRYQRLPVSLTRAVYDPSAILDPERGVPKLLTAGRDARTEAREDVGGQPAYRVRATFDQQALGPLLPGVTGQVTGTLWIGADRPRVLRARFEVPAATGGTTGAPGVVTVTLSDYDRPTTIRPPS